MKKILYTLVAVATMASCTNNTLDDIQPATPTTPQSGEKLNSFTATIGDATRVDLGDKTAEGYPLRWEDGDQITITDGTTTGTYQLVAVSAEGVGTFEVMEGRTAVVAGAEQYTAWCGEGASYSNGTFSYTIPETQTYTENHNLSGKLPLFAQSATTTLSFKTPVAILRLNLTKEEAIGIDQIQILGHFSSEPMAGKFENTIDNGEFQATTIVSGSSNLTYEAGGEVVDSEGKSFFLIVPALTYTYSTTSKCFHIQCTYSDGYGDYFRPSKTIITKAGVVMPLTLPLRKVTRLSGLAKMYDLSEATTVVFKARSNEDFSDSSRFVESEDIDNKYYPAYIEWTGDNGTDAILHTAADAFVAQTSGALFDATGNYSYADFFLNLRSIDFGDHLDLSQTTSVGSMFRACYKLEEINFGAGFKTSHITNMGKMFSGCTSLKTIDFSQFDTSNVTDMSYMFDGCTGLEELDLTSFDLTKLPTSGGGKNSWGGTYMFRGVGKNATNKPIKIYLNDASYKHIEYVRERKAESYPDSSELWLGSGEGTNWVLVNADAQ